jgi:hypothetical protein
MRTNSMCSIILAVAASVTANLTEGATAMRLSSQNDLALPSDRVWIEASSQKEPVRLMMTFLTNGTLILGSCGKAYELIEWNRDAPGRIGWQQDFQHVSADVISISIVELVLEIGVGTATTQHIFRAVEAPFKG